MAPLPDPSTMTDREVFFTVLRDSIGNVIWYGGAVIVILVIGKIYWWAGIVLFAVFATITVIGAVHSLFGIVMGIASVPLSIREKLQGRSAKVGSQIYFGASNAVQVLENIIFAGYIYLLYRAFFGL